MKRLSLFLTFLLLTAPASAAPVTVQNCGEPLTFDKIPERMIVHDLNMTQMAFALDLQDRIIGLTGISGWYKTGPEFAELRGEIPELAPKYPSLETLVAASPDLFFAGWNYGMKPGGEVTPDSLAPFGIKTLVLTESCVHLHKSGGPASMELLFTDVLRLGKIFDKEMEAEALVAAWRTKLAGIKAKVGSAAPVRVFLYDSGEDKPFTAGKYAMPSAMIAAAGGENVTANLEISWGRTSWEAVAASDPEALILLDYQDGAGAGKLLEFLEDHPAMKAVKAVREKRFVALRYGELTPGPANISALEKIARLLHPEAF